MTKATAPVAAEIIAGRPPTTAMVTAMMKLANSPRRGSTPAMMENEIASGMRASATTRPARTSVRSRLGLRNAARVEVSRSPASGTTGMRGSVGTVVVGSVMGPLSNRKGNVWNYWVAAPPKGWCLSTTDRVCGHRKATAACRRCTDQLYRSVRVTLLVAAAAPGALLSEPGPHRGRVHLTEPRGKAVPSTAPRSRDPPHTGSTD